ncbi:MAG: hypothetical protein RMI56_00225 [Sulfolobales archaeon]|nr:hypothetical protein [Sulfolobales archaeon]MDW8082205.1 hypothetical protein [Sulfolobales archaeon]
MSYSSAEISLAESNMVEQLTNIYRLMSDEIRELNSMIRETDLTQSILVEKRYDKVRKLKNDVESASMSLMEYFIKVAEYISSRELYVMVVDETIRVAEDLEAAAYRLYLVNKLGGRIPDRIYVILSEVSKKIISLVDLLSDMIRNIDNSKVIKEMFSEAMKMEDSIDELYREGGLECLKISGDFIGASILKEALDKLEDSADIAKRVATYIWFLSSFK